MAQHAAPCPAPTTAERPQWTTVDEGWGHDAVDFATLLEPAAVREYVALFHHVGLRPGDRLLDVACGSGLAMELAAAQGAHVAGVDASGRLVRIARDRVPTGDVRVGDMADLPWPDASFDVVTSFRGLWATTVPALHEARRVLRPGGRIAVTSWGDVRRSPGFFALEPFGLAAEEKVRAQADMKALGRPGVGERLLADAGFVGVRRFEVPFVWEFADADTFARALASTGPAYEAIQQVGAEEFHRRCRELAADRVRNGLPLRAEIACVGLTGRAPTALDGRPVLDEAARTPEVEALEATDLADLGFVSNVARLWQHDPSLLEEVVGLAGTTARSAGLDVAERGVATVTATMADGDTYCPLAWGDKLAGAATPSVAESVLRGEPDLLDERSRAVAAWARRVATDPSPAGSDDLEALHRAGFDDAGILRLTTFVALRLAFSRVNGVLGAAPEAAYVERVDPQVRAAWTDAVG